jgi:hypothetical protein
VGINENAQTDAWCAWRGVIGVVGSRGGTGPPARGENYWDVTSVKIDDGHFGEYADFLAGQFAKITSCEVEGLDQSLLHLQQCQQSRRRAGLYLVTVSDHLATPPSRLRTKEINAAMQTNDRRKFQAAAGRRPIGTSPRT